MDQVKVITGDQLKNTDTGAKRRIGRIVRCVAFLSVFIMLFVSISYLFRPTWNTREQNGFYEFYAEPKNTLDMVYLGGSVCITSWAPYEAWKETGVISYSFGVSMLLPTAYIPLIKEVYKHQSPQLVIIDLRPFQYGGDYCYTDAEVRMTSDWMPYSLNRFQFVRDTLMHFPAGTVQDAPSYYADLIKYHGEWQHLTENSFRYSGYGRQISPSKGFAFIERATQEQSWFDGSAVTREVPITELAETALRELITFLQDHNQQALFVVTPYGETQQHRMTYNYIKDIVEGAGFRYWNANDLKSEIGVDRQTDFYDANHMNIWGAEKYTKYLAHYIDETYDLPDLRNDPAYADWYAGYDTWRNLGDACKLAIQQQDAQLETAREG